MQAIRVAAAAAAEAHRKLLEALGAHGARAAVVRRVGGAAEDARRVVVDRHLDGDLVVVYVYGEG